jgi:hypothetical protein
LGIYCLFGRELSLYFSLFPGQFSSLDASGCIYMLMVVKNLEKEFSTVSPLVIWLGAVNLGEDPSLLVHHPGELLR